MESHQISCPPIDIGHSLFYVPPTILIFRDNVVYLCKQLVIVFEIVDAIHVIEDGIATTL